ncbi:sulfite exporter TauE/SafE family protein [Bacillus aquiflavi]|nr:sulfite exporter TauE/SafE family protein [Bacillus aquiflavi]
MELMLFFLLGGFISVLSGFFGIGGGFILTPTLLLIGLSPIEAITTSLLYTIGTSFSGMIAHYRLRNIMWKEGAIIGLSGVLATQAAHPVVLYLDNHGLDKTVIPALYILLLTYFIFKMVTKHKVEQKPTEMNTQVETALPKLIVIGFFAGFVSTTLGVGGGFIIVPLTIALLHFHAKKAVGTSLFAVLLIVSAGFISYASTIEIDYKTGLFLVLGGLIGSQFGAKLTTYYSSVEINLLLALLYTATLSSVVLKIFHFNLFGLLVLFTFLAYFFVQSGIKVRHRHIKKKLTT